MDPYRDISMRQTPQSEPVPGQDQHRNNAGGFGFAVDDFVRLDRFLVLGSSGGTYYVKERELTAQNAECVLRCIKADGWRTVLRIAEISESGRAPKNDPALFALAMCAAMGDEATRKMAFDALPKVARIGTHLFHFAQYCSQFRGTGRLFRRGIGGWYRDKGAVDLSLQLCKYQSRDGWSHRDLLRLAHPEAPTPEHEALFRWVTAGAEGMGERVVNRKGRGVKGYAATGRLPGIVEAFEIAKRVTAAKDIVALVRERCLPRECVPTQFLKDLAVWEALLENMPMTAMIRNLATMTRVGLLAPLSAATSKVAAYLANAEAIHRARIHPIAVLAALVTYAQGHGERGQHTWTPVPQIIDALDGAFYLSFRNVTATGKRFYLALDLSASMTWNNVSGVFGLRPREASAAMAMVTARTEPAYYVAGFSTGMIAVPVTASQRLDDVVRTIERTPAGGTDCALPMLDALQKRIPVDVFIIYTDAETHSGYVHPCQALREYRQKMGVAAKLVVVGMTATEITIADKDDGGMLDVVGFDAAIPEVIRDFVTG